MIFPTRTRQSFVIATGVLLSVLLTGIGSAAVRPVPDAAERGDIATVRQQLRSGADVNESHGDGMTALHWAAERGDTELAEMLIVAGANVEAGTRLGAYTPLHLASRNGHAAVVRALLAANADPDKRTTNSGVAPIHLAAASPNPETVRVLLDAGADVNATEGSWDQTPLVFAAAANRVDIIRMLLDAGADPSITSRTVDVVESEQADKAANKRLVAVLAEFKEKAGGGADWLPQAVEVQGAINFSREIQRKWPDVPDPACEEQGDGAASRFSRAGGPGKCNRPDADDSGSEAALESGSADTETPPPRRMSYGEWVGSWGGRSPLLHAVREGHQEAALALLDGGADIDQASAGDKTTPLLMAAVNGQFDLAMVLLERGANPNLVSDAGTGPLFAVIERQWAPWSHYAHPVDYQEQQATHLEVLAALLEAGADPNVRLEKHLWFVEFTTTVLVPAGLQYDGATPFWRAAQALDVEAMRLLKAHGADPGIPTRTIPTRRGQRRDPMEEQEEEEKDYSGLPPTPLGGPAVYPLHAAAGAGYGQYFMAHAHRHVPDNWLPAVRYLIEECGAEVNARDSNGYSPLHHAASRGDNKLIKYLLAKGANPKLVSRLGQTTADMANGPTQRVAPFPDTIALLVSLGVINHNNCVSC
jgi:ankyrin repeat protein